MSEYLSLDLIAHLGWPIILLICVIAFITSTIHGAAGVAGGFLLSAALAPIIGVKPIVPVISVALLISHTTRALLNASNVDRKAFLRVIIPATPFILIVAFLYGKMSVTAIGMFLGCVILASIPIRHWASSRQIKVSDKGLSTAGAVYGALAGASIGPGMILIPFMLGYGLTKEAFVATMAVIALAANVLRLGIYGNADLLDGGYLMLGIMIGLMTIPGNWFGRSVLKRMTNNNHSKFVDILSVLGGLNFFWLALRS